MNSKILYICLAAAALVVLGFGLEGLGKALGGNNQGFFNVSKKGGIVNVGLVEGIVDIDAFEELDVDNSSIGFVIESGSTYSLEYCVPEGKEPVIRCENGKLRIKEPENIITASINYSGKTICYRLTVPEESEFDAKVKTTSGGIAIGSCGISGSISSSSGGIALKDISGSKLSVNTTSGGIALAKAEYSGKVSLTSSSGGIGITEIECEELTTETTSGGLGIDSCAADKYTHESSSGSFNAGSMNVYDMTVKTTSGSIRVADTITGNIQATSSSGSVKIDVDEVESVKCEATSGHITLNLPGEEGDYSFDIHTNSGSIRVGGNKTEKKYETERSGKHVEVRNSSGGVTVEF